MRALSKLIVRHWGQNERLCFYRLITIFIGFLFVSTIFHVNSIKASITPNVIDISRAALDLEGIVVQDIPDKINGGFSIGQRRFLLGCKRKQRPIYVSRRPCFSSIGEKEYGRPFRVTWGQTQLNTTKREWVGQQGSADKVYYVVSWSDASILDMDFQSGSKLFCLGDISVYIMNLHDIREYVRAQLPFFSIFRYAGLAKGDTSDNHSYYGIQPYATRREDAPEPLIFALGVGVFAYALYLFGNGIQERSVLYVFLSLVFGIVAIGGPIIWIMSRS